MEKHAVIAIGGNALILEGQRGTIAEQSENARVTASHIASLVADGWRVVLTHGNGPQVGFILWRSELISASVPVPRLTLDLAVADSQGGLGYIVGQALVNELGKQGIRDRVACVMTQVVVDPADPAFEHPSKPIGPSFSDEDAVVHETKDGWVMVEDSGRGRRRVVPSPRPRRIVEAGPIRALVDAGFVVIACGGGGIPVIETANGEYRGVEAVIDKDLASALLATSLGVPILVISTGVEKVAIRYRKPDQVLLSRVGSRQMGDYLAAGEFPPGSMGPKVRAALQFLEQGGQEVVITSPDHLEEALAGRTGTHIVADERRLAWQG